VERGRRLLAALAALLPLLAGALLRLWNLPAQVMGGDELHAVRDALAQPLSTLLTTYQTNDNCIPLTALDRLLLVVGAPLTEMRIRLPVLACGLLAVVLVPWAAERGGWLGGRQALLFRWLVALSPVLVLYSRIARSYLPIVLFGFGALAAFERWWRERRRRDAALYAVLAALAVWFHLGAAPLVGAPFLFAAGDLALARRPDSGSRKRDLRDLALLALALALLVALFLVPAAPSLAHLVAGKRREQVVPVASWLHVLRLQAGTGEALLAALFWGAAAAGAVLLVRARPRLGLFTLVAAAGQVAGILLLSPLALAYPLALDRYLLPALPFALFWVAVALGHPWWPRQARTGAALQLVAAFAFLAALAATGPFADPAFRASPFSHHNDYVDFVAPRAALAPDQVPAVYRQMRQGPVLEFPWPSVWGFDRTFYVYQEVHGLPVVVSTPGDPIDDPRLAFRNLVLPAPAAFLASGARWAVIHVRLPWEEDRLPAPPGAPPARQMRPRLRHLYRGEGERMAAGLRSLWGAPDYADGVVSAWDLARVRAGGGAQNAAAAASASAATSAPARKPGGR
jgi:hypothetical protein